MKFEHLKLLEEIPGWKEFAAYDIEAFKEEVRAATDAQLQASLKGHLNELEQLATEGEEEDVAEMQEEPLPPDYLQLIRAETRIIEQEIQARDAASYFRLNESKNEADCIQAARDWFEVEDGGAE
jgi:hypothetical protein